jgi:hypothetical protein
MECNFCDEKPKLLTIIEFTKGRPHSYDFDQDGKQFKICPNCLSCDNAGLRAEREHTLTLLKLKNQFSGRDKQKVIQILCDRKEMKWEEKKLTVSSLLKQLKDVSDRKCKEILSLAFGVEIVRVDILFYNIKVYRREVRKYREW